MPRIPIITNHAFVTELENMVENLGQLSLDETIEFRNLERSTQVALAQGCHILMSLPHLPAQKTNGRKPLVEYSQNHFISSRKIRGLCDKKQWIRRSQNISKKAKGKKKQVKKHLSCLL
jgi:hypothetical protein